MSARPLLYEINTRVVLGEIRPGATLDDLADAYLDDLSERGIRLVWLLGIWQTGPAGRQISRTNPAWLTGYLHDLPDLRESDICGSPFAIRSYTVHSDFGGEDALARLRARLSQRGIGLILDFVPNHIALDHPWTLTHREFLISGTEADLARDPDNFVRLTDGAILAHGKDPHYSGWPDTVQLNYRHLGLRKAMMQELAHIAELCDGVRCDMAMLLLPDIFRTTWGERSRPGDGSPAVDEAFWPEATAFVRQRHPSFLFLAEVYWDLEWTLLQQGFDYTYDKRLYDRLLAGQAEAVRGHLTANLDFQNRCVRFLENHDEPRAATAFGHYQHRAAAVVTYLTPGLRFFHEGQWEGRKAHASVHLSRRQAEPVAHELRAFYYALLAACQRPELQGRWELLPVRPAWEGNQTARNFLTWAWTQAGTKLVAVVNYGGTTGQCYLRFPWPELAGRKVHLRDILGPARYDRDGNDLIQGGLYLDLWPWGYHVFELV